MLSILNTLFFVAVIVVNALANALPINGMNTGEISDLYPSLFTPSGITFSIWSVIYAGLIALVATRHGDGVEVRLTYAELRALETRPDALRPPDREIELHLTGHMERFVWSFDGIPFSGSTPIERTEAQRQVRPSSRIDFL